MRTIICGALMALMITPVDAAENQNSANFMLPYCEAFLDRSQSTDLLWQGFCAGTIETLAFMAGYSDVAINAFSGPGQLRFFKQKSRRLDTPQGVTTGYMIRGGIRYTSGQ